MPVIEELEQGLVAAQTEEEKIRTLNALAQALRDKEPKRALAIASEALVLMDNRTDLPQEQADALLSKGIAFRMLADYPNALSATQAALPLFEALNDKRSLVASLGNIGNAYHYLSDFANALQYHEQSLAISKEIGDMRSHAASLGNISNVYSSIADYPKALRFGQQSLSLYQDIGEQMGAAISLFNLGLVHYEIADYSNALLYYQQSLAIGQDVGFKHGVLASLGAIGNVYLALADYPNALQYFQQSLALSEEISDKMGATYSLNAIGSVYLALADYPMALQHYQQSLAMKQEIGDRLGIADSLSGIGSTLLKLGSFTQAEQHLAQSLALAEELGLKQQRFGVLQRLADLYAQTGQFEIAYQTHLRFHIAEKEVHNADTQKQLTQLQARFETEQAKRAAELSAKEAELFRLRNIELAEFKANITASIEYAFRIQSAVLPDNARISSSLSDWFVLYKPQAIVSGDFYWFHDFGEARFIAVGDCTGHGVPGAFMSLLGMDFLTQLIIERRIESPAEILSRLHKAVQRALGQEQSGDIRAVIQDGMDIALIKIDGTHLTFAGARRPLYLVQLNNASADFVELKGERVSIGGYSEKPVVFTNQVLELSGGERIYLSTDGFGDMGNREGKTFGRKRLRDLLTQLAPLPMTAQRAQLEETMRLYQADTEQRDDITLFGFTIPT